jgi:hypothetical protein
LTVTADDSSLLLFCMELAEINVDLEAFQILYTTIKGFACSMDQFRLVAVTRQHMISLLGRDPNFVGLKLQHTLSSSRITSGPIFKNGTKAVFVGRAIYNGTAPSTDAMLTMENLCFLGENQTAYVDSLRQVGCKSLDMAHLMTNAGEVGVVSVVDDDEEEDNDYGATAPDVTESQQDDEENDNNSTASIVLITVIILLVPVSLLLLLVMVCLVRQQIRHINWEMKSDKDPYWRTDHPLAQERLKVITDFEPEVLERSKCISTDSSGSSSATNIMVEEQQQRTRSPPRRRSKFLESEDASSVQEDDDDDDDESAEINSTSSITVHV